MVMAVYFFKGNFFIYLNSLVIIFNRSSFSGTSKRVSKTAVRLFYVFRLLYRLGLMSSFNI